jgi:hypothetical protein
MVSRWYYYSHILYPNIIHLIDVSKNEKIEYYIDYLKQHRNTESRVEHALQLCNQSKSVNIFPWKIKKTKCF